MCFNLTEQVNIRFKTDTPLSYFKDQLMNSTGNKVTDVEFFTIAGAKIPLCEQVVDLNDFPVLLQVNKTRIFAMNFSQEFEVERTSSKDITSEEYYFDFASGIGLKGYQKYFLPSFAFKLMQMLPKNKAEVTGQEVGSSIA